MTFNRSAIFVVHIKPLTNLQKRSFKRLNQLGLRETMSSWSLMLSEESVIKALHARMFYHWAACDLELAAAGERQAGAVIVMTVGSPN